MQSWAEFEILTLEYPFLLFTVLKFILFYNTLELTLCILQNPLTCVQHERETSLR